MKFHFIPKSVRITLVRGGLFVIAFTVVEYVGSLMFGASHEGAGKDALSFLTDTSLYLLGFFFLMIFAPRFISKALFFRDKGNAVTDPYLMHKRWEQQ